MCIILASTYGEIRKSVLFYRCLLSIVAIYFTHENVMKMEFFYILPT